MGIAYYEAGGRIDTVEIANVTDTPLSGSQAGLAVFAQADNGTARSLEVTGSNIHDFQKNGMTFLGGNLSANVHGNNLVVGFGSTPTIARERYSGGIWSHRVDRRKLRQRRVAVQARPGPPPAFSRSMPAAG